MSGDSTKITRRQALRITAAAGVALAFGGGMGRALFDRAALRRVSESRIQMGTQVTVTVMHPDAATARGMVEATFAEIDRLESVLSRHRSDTPVARLSREGAIADAPEELTHVLTRANEFATLTGGAFDVTVAPVLDLYRSGMAAGDPRPDRAALDARLALVDYRAVRLEGQGIYFERPGMAITLDGIAKGFVVDRAVETLVAGGADRVLVAASGDVATSRVGADDGGWDVAIQDPRDVAGALGVIRLQGQAVATSGDYMQAFTQDRSLHHIIDPRTGRSPAEISAVTTIAPSAMEADALSTATFVLGTDDGLALLESLEGVEGLIVTKDGRQLRTKGFGRVG